MSCQTTALYTPGKKSDSQIFLSIFDNKSPLTDLHLFVSIVFQPIASVWYVLSVYEFYTALSTLFLSITKPFLIAYLANYLEYSTQVFFHEEYPSGKEFRERTDGELR